jgi:glucose/arabinose dehydrogenase
MNARILLATAACIAIGACSSGNDDFDKSTQYGPDPQLPEPSRALLPRMNVSKVVGWAQGETPTVPQGFKIEAIATGLSNPRNVYPLANGDLLVVESKKDAKEPLERPKRKIMDWIEAKAHGGSDNGPSNRILLLRDSNGDGKPDARSVLIDHLNSPFGVVLVGDALYSRSETARSAKRPR